MVPVISTDRVFAFLFAALFLFAGTAHAQDGVGIQNPDQSTPTVLYMHVIDALNAFPVNTQPPDDRYNKDSSFGLGTNSKTCFTTPADGAAPIISKEYHTYYGYSTPGYVQYDFQDGDGPRFHPERGISFDATLDTSAPFTVYWYMATQATAGDNDALPADPNDQPVVVPNVKAIATLREGDDISIGNEKLNEGRIIAQGETEAATLEPNAPNHHEYDGRHVYEFAIPMKFEHDTITRDGSYNIRIDVVMEVPSCDSSSDEYVMPNLVRVHTSPEFRPRMDLSVMNAIRIEYIHPQFVGEDLVVHTSFNSPWGNYDVDETPGGIEVAINGPSEATSLTRAAFVQKHHEHYKHQEPVDVSYVWPYKNDGAAKGQYSVDVMVWNDQRTAQAVGKVLFDIGKNIAIDDQGNEVKPVGQTKGKESPGAGLVAALAVLGATLLLVRRRQ